jgi:hypothetical protein
MTQKVKKPSRLLKTIYETAVDFHNDGVFSSEQMQKYQEIAPSSIFVKLDKDVADFFNQKCNHNTGKIQILINDLLRKGIGNI